LAAIVTAQDLVKSYGNRHVLRGVSLAVHDKDRIGLIGANGTGKSTLLKILVGDEQADEGTVTWRRDLVLEYVPQEPRLPLDQTIGQVLSRAPDHEAHTVAAALQLPAMDRVVGQLSIGERRRVALAHALLGKPEVLCLDEPTNHLDARTIEWLETRLAA
jgi:ATP-binding cassette subfamily F protein uup